MNKTIPAMKQSTASGRYGYFAFFAGGRCGANAAADDALAAPGPDDDEPVVPGPGARAVASHHLGPVPVGRAGLGGMGAGWATGLW